MAEANGNMEVHHNCTLTKNNMQPTSVEKILLEKTTMNVHRFGRVVKNLKIEYRLVIWEQTKSKPNKNYNADTSDARWTFSVFRRGSNVIVKIKSDRRHSNLGLKISPEPGRLSEFYPAKEVDNNSYKIIFPHSELDGHNFMDLRISWNKREPLIMSYPLSERRVYRENVYTASKNPQRPSKNEDDEMAESLMEIHKKKRFVNFDIRVGDKTIPVHKALLAARSKLFRDYIDEHCEDGIRGVAITETTYEVMVAVVNFLYTGEIKVNEADEMVDVLALATKLQLSKLKIMCAHYLQEHMSGEDVIKRNIIEASLEMMHEKDHHYSALTGIEMELTSVEKISLENTSVNLHRFGRVSRMKMVRFHLSISNYRDLEKKTNYRKQIPNLNWNVTISKKGFMFVVKVKSDRSHPNIFLQIRKSNGVPLVYAAQEIGEHSYKMQFPSLELNDQRDMDLFIIWTQKNIFVKNYPLAEKRIFRQIVYTASKDPKLPIKNEDDEMTESLMNICRNKRFVNFEIILEDNSKIPVHKALLAARSKFFRDYIEEHCEIHEVIRIYTTNEAMHAVVSFLYSGEMEVKEADEMEEVAALAIKFELFALEDMCINYLKECMLNRGVINENEIKSLLNKICDRAIDIEVYTVTNEATE